jgi:peptidyl-prolyl cis-trans isomerase C
MIRSTLISLIVLSAAFCCTASAQQPTPAEPSPETAKTREDANLVVSKVSGRPITEREVMLAIAQLASQKQVSLEQQQKRNAVFFQEALDQLTTMSLLSAQAQEQNLPVDKSVVDRQLKLLSERFASPEEFAKAMAERGLTETDLRREFEQNLGAQEMLRQAVKDVPEPTDEEISKFYADNTGKFSMPAQVHASHILLKVDPKSTPEQKEEIKKKLEGIRADIESQKITFAEAASKYSEDTSNASKGGDLGSFPRGAMVKPFEDAAFATLPGNISPIVETRFGYHLIQVTELKPAGTATLEQAKPAITQFLSQTEKAKAARKYLEDLKAHATIETFMTQEEFLKRHPDKSN